MDLQSISKQALEFYRRGNLAGAEQLYSQILALDPGNFTARHMLGVIRHQQGRNSEALELIGAALKINPNAANAVSNYGLVLVALGRHEEALANFDKALAIKPDYVEALSNRGNILYGLKRFDEALASYDQALAINPNHAEALNNRGNILHGQKRFEEALASYDKAVATTPNFAEAWNNRGNTLHGLKRFGEAVASYDKALEKKPDYFEALNNRGIALWRLRRLDEALTSYDKALAVNPDFAASLFNRGLVLSDLKRFEEALMSYDRALAINPDHLYSHMYALDAVAQAALRCCALARVAKIAGALRTHIVEGRSLVQPFTLLGYSNDAPLQLQCARSFIQNMVPIRPRPLRDGTAHRNDRIKIAYLSSDFKNHAVANLAAELFERHDRSRFELTAISFGSDDGSKMRARIVRAFDHFIDVRGQSDHEVASFLKESKVDIAVDLSGHTQEGRLGILSHRPCPVQVNYLGYPSTTGAEFMDYMIGDKIMLPFDQQPFFAEKIVHLPDCYLTYDTRKEMPGVTPTRAEAGLPEQSFVFCCFNNSWKITAPLFDVWMRLLGSLPGSVLWLLQDSGAVHANLRAEAAARGINPQRLIFAPRVTPEDHLARHRLADLFLDTLPYNAHTTACDALWAGLPLVTCKGESIHGRVAASLLSAIGLPELVTDSLEAYEALALDLARDSSLLQSFRHTLNKNRSTQPLFDTDRLRRNLEAAYTTMWEIWQRGGSPRSFSVEP